MNLKENMEVYIGEFKGGINVITLSSVKICFKVVNTQ